MYIYITHNIVHAIIKNRVSLHKKKNNNNKSRM